MASQSFTVTLANPAQQSGIWQFASALTFIEALTVFNQTNGLLSLYYGGVSSTTPDITIPPGAFFTIPVRTKTVAYSTPATAGTIYANIFDQPMSGAAGSIPTVGLPLYQELELISTGLVASPYTSAYFDFSLYKRVILAWAVFNSPGTGTFSITSNFFNNTGPQILLNSTLGFGNVIGVMELGGAGAIQGAAANLVTGIAGLVPANMSFGFTFTNGPAQIKLCAQVWSA